MRWLTVLSVVLSAVGAGHAEAGNKSTPRQCDEWNAVYVSQPDEDGARVLAAFGKAEGATPLSFTLTGTDRSGNTLWAYKTQAWCFLGSGGCHIGLRMKGESMEAAVDRPLRLLFVRSSKTDTEAVPDILILSGLTAEFLDSARRTGSNGLAIERFTGGPETVLPPDAYCFERCKVDCSMSAMRDKAADRPSVRKVGSVQSMIQKAYLCEITCSNALKH